MIGRFLEAFAFVVFGQIALGLATAILAGAFGVTASAQGAYLTLSYLALVYFVPFTVATFILSEGGWKVCGLVLVLVLLIALVFGHSMATSHGQTISWYDYFNRTFHEFAVRAIAGVAGIALASFLHQRTGG